MRETNSRKRKIKHGLRYVERLVGYAKETQQSQQRATPHFERDVQVFISRKMDE